MSITKKEFGANCLYFLGLLLIATTITLFGVAIIAGGFEGIIQLGGSCVIAIVIVFMLLCIIHIYSVWIIMPSYKKFSKIREYFIVNSIILLTSLISCFVFKYFSPYAIPIATASLIVAMLLSQRLGIMVGVFTSGIVGVITWCGTVQAALLQEDREAEQQNLISSLNCTETQEPFTNVSFKVFMTT